MSLLKTLLSFGTEEYKLLKRFKKRVAEINALEPQYKGLSDADLKGKTQEFKSRLATGETLDDILPEAFALVREASRRTLNERHYDVQLIGGQVLHYGAIAEMRTGEGKTLVATLAAYLNALSGDPVHVVTVNEYLSRRDAGEMGIIYGALGMTTGVVLNSQSRDEKKKNYNCDIVYVTNTELGFDYLRDNMAPSIADQVMSRRAFAIVDEVDSILVDEARTPLIISAPDNEPTSKYIRFAQMAGKLSHPEHYTIDEKTKTVALTEDGIERIEKTL